MLKPLCAVMILCICGTDLFAQQEINQPPLSAVPNIYYTSFVQPVSACHCTKTDPTPKKQGSVFSLDIPIISSWDTIGEDRIKNNTVQIGSLAPDWAETTKSDKWPLPRTSFSTGNFRIKAEGGIMEVSTSSFRKMGQADMAIERSVWFVLAGASGFFGQEEVPEFSRYGLNFSADFRRLSAGGQGWLGLKFGNFNQNFLAVRYGRGYVYTNGSVRFNIPEVDGLDWLPLYSEEFETESFSIEGKAKIKLISQSLRVNRGEYKRVIPSPDPMRFGENRFEDMWLTAETEITPLSKISFLRGVVVLTKDFRDKNRLMFFNDYSAVRFFIRLSFD